MASPAPPPVHLTWREHMIGIITRFEGQENVIVYKQGLYPFEKMVLFHKRVVHSLLHEHHMKHITWFAPYQHACGATRNYLDSLNLAFKEEVERIVGTDAKWKRLRDDIIMVNDYNICLVSDTVERFVGRAASGPDACIVFHPLGVKNHKQWKDIIVPTFTGNSKVVMLH